MSWHWWALWAGVVLAILTRIWPDKKEEPEPRCFGDYRHGQAAAERCCYDCPFAHRCFEDTPYLGV